MTYVVIDACISANTKIASRYVPWIAFTKAKTWSLSTPKNVSTAACASLNASVDAIKPDTMPDAEKWIALN